MRNNWNRQREIERFAWNRGKEDSQLQVSAKNVPGKEICQLPGQLTPSGSTNPGRDFFRKNSLTKSKTLDKSTRQEKYNQLLTNAIANAGIGGRRNIWNLYLHLCWHESAEQSNPAHAIASTVTNKL